MFGIETRALVYLRSIVKSLESLAACDKARFDREFAKPKPKQVVIGTLDIAEAERRYEMANRAREEGMDLEEL